MSDHAKVAVIVLSAAVAALFVHRFSTEIGSIRIVVPAHGSAGIGTD